MRENHPQMPETLTDRGIGWQATGFTLTGMACLLILKLFEGSDFWLYQWFEMATVRLYWSFVVPLAALFDGGRKLFEKGRAIREAQKARMVQRAHKKGTEEENRRIRKVLETHGVTLDPEVAEAIFRKPTEIDS